MKYIRITILKNILNEIPLFHLLHVQYEFGVNGTYVYCRMQDV
jgi:hypothetical protein